MQQILVPLDGSETSAQVLPSLLPLASRGPVHLLLLRVRTDADEGDVEAELELTRARLAALGLQASTRIEDGDPAERILACAAQEPVDWVAMGSHGRSGMTRLVRGSVAERVLRSCAVPLLLCSPSSAAVSDPAEPPFQRVLVPLDGSPQAERVLPLVERLALAYGSEVTLLRVEGALAAPPSRMFRPDCWTPARTAGILAPLTPPRDRLARAGVEVRRHVAYGNAADEIVALSGKFDLIALTSHGRSGVSRWFFGSVAEAVLRRARCPLLVVRVAEAGVAGADPA